MQSTFWRIKKRKGSPFYQAHRQFNGKKQRVSTGTDVKHQAKALIARWNHELADPAAAARVDALLGAVAIAYMKALTTSAPAATVRYYQRKLNRVIKTLGSNLPLHQVTVQTHDHYIEYRLASHPCARHQGECKHDCRDCVGAAKRTTVKKELGALRRVLDFAARRQMFFADPRIVIPQFKAQYEPRRTWLTAEEAERLWQELRQRNPHRAAHLAWFLGTGARLGEAVRAQRDHVQTDRVYIPGSKTQASAQTIPITDIMRRWIERALADAPGGDDELLLAPWLNITRDLRSACQAAGAPIVTANDLRRTMVTWHYHQGVPPFLLAKLARHTTTAMVQRVYAQHDDDALAAMLAAYIPVQGQKDKNASATPPEENDS